MCIEFTDCDKIKHITHRKAQFWNQGHNLKELRKKVGLRGAFSFNSGTNAPPYHMAVRITWKLR